jgi:hypothetical protein
MSSLHFTFQICLAAFPFQFSRSSAYAKPALLFIKYGNIAGSWIIKDPIVEA